MRLLSLRLIAYGPFTDQTLDFSGSTGLHIVYGLNEAGKSSALRAVRHLLFGIPERTADGFLHANPSLRIGGAVVDSRGARLDFVRRKGRGKTLRSADDSGVLDDEALAPFLGGVDQAFFERMFAIGHDELVTGGQEILSGGGGVGQALFAAGAGLIRLQSVQQALYRQCEALFKPSGSKPKINAAITALSDTRKNLKDALLPAKTWKTRHQGLAQAQARMEAVQEKIVTLKRQSGKLERIGKALPLIGRKKQIDEQVLALKDIPELLEDFEARRRNAQTQLHMAENEINRLAASIEELGTRHKALVVPKDLIGYAQMIEELQPERGQYRKAQKDRPVLEAGMRTLKRRAADKLAQIGKGILAGAGKDLRLAPSVVGEIQDMGKVYERLTTREETARERRGKLETLVGDLEQRKNDLAAPADVGLLKIAVQAAVEAGPLEKQLAEKAAVVQRLENELQTEAGRLPMFTGSLEALDVLACPSKESIDRFEAHFEADLKELEKLAAEKRAVEQEIGGIQAELNAIERYRDVPTETDLDKSRRRRDDGWGLIRQTLEGSLPPDETIEAFAGRFEGASGLAGAFETSVAQADQIADRLRREADQVSKKSLLEASRQRGETKRYEVEAALAAVRRTHEQLQGQWRQLWAPAGIEPLFPREMRAWLDQVQSIRDKLAVLHQERAGAEAIAAEVKSLKTQLCLALEASGKPISPASLSKTIQLAKAWVQTNEELASQRQSLEKELAGLWLENKDNASTIAGLEAELAVWKQRWAKVVAGIGLDADDSPAAAQMVIESIREAIKLLDEADVLEKRIEGIDRDAADFEKSVADLVNTLARDLLQEPVEKAAALLNTRLTEARELAAKQKSMEEQIGKATAERQQVEKRSLDARAAIEALCREARCQDPGQLEEIEKQSQAKQKAADQNRLIEERLHELAAGSPLGAFIAEAAATDPDGVAPEMERLSKESEAYEKEREQLSDTIAEEKAELKRMDGSERAAALAEQSEHLLAGLEADVEAYAQLKIAAVLLACTIERYREKHQGPLITKASELFARITKGSFAGVRADYDDKANPVLVGVRPSTGVPVAVAGMSDGTADQLYLALRLAGLEQYLEKSEPLPFVVDDILLRFDDQRALATLKVLGDLSRKTQVVFFTHHLRIAELARDNIDPSVMTHHVLGA